MPTALRRPGLSRRQFIVSSAAAGLALPSVATSAEAWPARAVTIVSPYNPGGTNDTVARVVAERLQRLLGQPFVVENRPGAAGVIGSTSVMRAKPDGYTLLSSNNGAMVVQAVVKSPSPYDPPAGFTPVAKYVDAVQFIGISSDVPAKTVAELIAVAKREPGKLNFSSAGIGSFGQFVGEYLKLQSGFDMVHVPSKGSAAALTELLAGRIQVMIDPLVLTQITNPRIRVLATLNRERFAGYPQIPTIRESGGPEVDLTGWFGLFGPAGLPAEVVEKIGAASRTLMADPEVQKTFVAAGLVPALTDSSAFGQLVTADLRRYADIKTRARMQVD